MHRPMRRYKEMSDNRFDLLEIGEEKPKVEPNKSVFTNVSSLQVRDNATATQDENGNWFNAIGLQSSADHRHVAKIWQDKCIALPTFMDTVKSISETKTDVLMKESDIRLKDINTLSDGTAISKSGIRSLIAFSEMPTTMFSYMEEYGYEEELTKIMNDALARRTSQWTGKGKEERNFRVRLRTDEADEKFVRAIVSERYGVIDNHEVMEILSNALPYNIDKALASHISHDGDDMFGNILLPDQMKSEPDSDYGVGIAFKNSEVRNSAFSIEPFIFRAICLNGMIWGRANSEIKVHQRHMGSIDLKELEEKVQQAIAVALTNGNDMLTLLKASKSVKVQNPIKTIIQLSKDSQDNMTIEQCKAWQRGYLESQLEPQGDVHTNSAFGIVNGLTRASQNYSGSVREKMERYASYVLAPAIDSDLQAISKRWGQISDRAESNISNKELERYQYVSA